MDQPANILFTNTGSLFISGFIFGVLILATKYQLLKYLITKNKTRLFLTMIFLCVIIGLFEFVSPIFGFTGGILAEKILPMCAAMGLAFAVLFTNRFLELRTTAPFIQKTLFVLLVISLLTATTPIFSGNSIPAFVFLTENFAIVLMLLLAGLIRYKKGKNYLISYFLSLIFPVISIFIFFMNADFRSNINLYQYSIGISFIIFVLLLTVSTDQQSNSLEEENIFGLKKAIEAERKKYEDLEKEVDKKTSILKMQNKRISTQSNVMEIQERRLLKQMDKLTQSENRLNSMMESVQVGIVLIDEQTDEIVEVNPVAAQMLGIKKSDIVSKALGKDIISVRLKDEFQTGEGANESNKTEEYFLRVGNEEIPVINSSSEIYISGKKHILKSFINIEKQKEAELALLKAKQIAEDANRAKSEFLATISHELRTPLHGILGFNELLKDRLKKDNDLLEYVETIEKSGRSLLFIINDILDLSKLETGQLMMKYEETNIDTIISDIWQVYSNEFKSKGIDFTIEKSEFVPQTVLLDSVRLTQIIFNLLKNALKFTDRGSVSIHFGVEQKEESMLTISIKDTGIGIAEDKFGIIFDAFRQQDGNLSRKYGGSGMGLAICKNLVELMNGSIIVESSQGKGSIFTISLPAVGERKTRNTSWFSNIEKVFFPVANLPSHRILVINDGIHCEDEIIYYFEKLGLNVFETHPDELTMEKFNTIQPEMVFICSKVSDLVSTAERLINNISYDGCMLIAVLPSDSYKLFNDPDKLFHFNIIKPIPRQLLADLLAKNLPKELRHRKTAIHQEVEQETEDLEPQIVIDYVKKLEDSENSKIIHHKLIESFYTIYDPLYKKVTESQSIHDTIELSERLIKAGKRFRVDVLTEFGNNLFQETESFNHPNIKQLLSQYPRISHYLSGKSRIVK